MLYFSRTCYVSSDYKTITTASATLIDNIFFRNVNGITQVVVINSNIFGLRSSWENTGCHVANCCVSNLSYADDIVLLATIFPALQKILDIFYNFDRPYDIVYNTSKTGFMLFSIKVLSATS